MALALYAEETARADEGTVAFIGTNLRAAAIGQVFAATSAATFFLLHVLFLGSGFGEAERRERTAQQGGKRTAPVA